MFTSIQKHYRGFFVQRDYETKEIFTHDMEKDHEFKSEICWAYLFTEDGKRIATYRRGYTTPDYLY